MFELLVLISLSALLSFCRSLSLARLTMYPKCRINYRFNHIFKQIVYAKPCTNLQTLALSSKTKWDAHLAKRVELHATLRHVHDSQTSRHKPLVVSRQKPFHRSLGIIIQCHWWCIFRRLGLTQPVPRIGHILHLIRNQLNGPSPRNFH